MNNNPKILVVGTKREETNHLEKCLMDCKYEITILYDNSTGIVTSMPKSPALILVYAQDEPKDTFFHIYIKNTFPGGKSS